MLPASTSGTSEGRTPADNQTVRNVFIIGPDKKIKLVLVYPMTTGRNFRRGACAWFTRCNSPRSIACDAGELEAGRRRHHHRCVTDDEAKSLRRLEDAEALYPHRDAAASVKTEIKPHCTLTIRARLRPRSYSLSTSKHLPILRRS